MLTCAQCEYFLGSSYHISNLPVFPCCKHMAVLVNAAYCPVRTDDD